MTSYEKSTVRVTAGRLFQTLSGLESGGSFGMTLNWSGDMVTVVSWRGKEGPCYETGRRASFEGPCLAVGDDDNHFIAGGIRVCEKTGGVYGSEAYSCFVTVTPPDPEKLALIETSPIPFDCDTLSDDAEAIASRLRSMAMGEKPEVSFMLCGPFRYAVLESGAILRRGLPAAISRESSRKLSIAGFGTVLDLQAPPAARFLDLFEKYGPLFLVGRGGGDPGVSLPDLDSLAGVSEKVKSRIRRMIEHDENYFMLQGTDPSTGGCCPLPDVGECNRLVGTGIFSFWVSPMSGACPVTAFSVAGEIVAGSGPMPRFSRNALLRRSIIEVLG